MKLLYLGTICDLKSYEKLLNNCAVKPSVAPIIFESSLLGGLKKNNVEVDVLSFPMIPSFPHFDKIYWGNKTEILGCGYPCTWLKTINIPILKQISRKLNGRKFLKKWLRKNFGQDCVVLSYSMPPFLVKDITKLSQKYNAKSVAIVTDLLQDMYVNEENNRLITALKNIYIRRAIDSQGFYDGYVYLTENMKERISDEKPYMVMEAIADIPTAEMTEIPVKADPAAIMYAGMLEEKYGVINLIEAFENSNLDKEELWLFGSGNAVDKILERAKKNSKIRYFGRKDREEVLQYEKAASLLVNPRNVKEPFTKYSFPSKTIEYMLSGTPMLTTRLAGIPQEYYRYLFVCDDNEPMTLQNALEQAMSISQAEREAIGECAKNYIKEKKNANKQAYRLIQFLMEVLKS